MARSEREAWEDVLAVAQEIAIEAKQFHPRASRFRAIAGGIQKLAQEMLRQLDRGLHANPALVIYGNPPRGAELMSKRVYAIEYQHADDGEDYRHDCSRGVSMFAQGDGTIILQRPDRKPLSKEFDV